MYIYISNIYLITTTHILHTLLMLLGFFSELHKVHICKILYLLYIYLQISMYYMHRFDIIRILQWAAESVWLHSAESVHNGKDQWLKVRGMLLNMCHSRPEATLSWNRDDSCFLLQRLSVNLSLDARYRVLLTLQRYVFARLRGWKFISMHLLQGKMVFDVP